MTFGAEITLSAYPKCKQYYLAQRSKDGSRNLDVERTGWNKRTGWNFSQN